MIAPGADLHAHTTASDGEFTPEELVRAARAAGIATLAVTDHDTMSGVAAAQAAGERMGVEVIAGGEM
ncbi:MAG: PHP domain-containing protein [Chloroflexota bacterium]|nr:PHP domain-containing protein [Chloroflexota bacterium]